MFIISILNNNNVKIFIALFIILQIANIIKLPYMLTNTEFKKLIYNLLLAILFVYYIYMC